jgi:hypothetical protein
MITKTYKEAIKRLIALGDTDEGFNVLALHAFVEGYGYGAVREGASFTAASRA